MRPLSNPRPKGFTHATPSAALACGLPPYEQLVQEPPKYPSKISQVLKKPVWWIAGAAAAVCMAAGPLTLAHAQQPFENRILRLALSNAAEEAGMCGVFFEIASQCLRSPPTEESLQLSSQFEQISQRAFQLSLRHADSAGLLREAMEASVQLNRDELTSRIADSCANIAILTAEYGESCVTVLNDQAGRVEHWMMEAAEQLRSTR